MIPVRPSALAAAAPPTPPVGSGAVPLPSDAHYAALHAFRRAALTISDENARFAEAEAELRAEHRDALAEMRAIRPGFDPRDPSTWNPIARNPEDQVPEEHRQALEALRAANPDFDVAYPSLSRVLQTAPDGADVADAHERGMQRLRAAVRAARIYRIGVQSARASVVHRDMHATYRNALAAMRAIHPPFNPDDRATWGVPPTYGTRYGGRVGWDVEKAWANESTPGSRSVAEEARDPRGRWTAGGITAQGRSDAQDGPGERWRLSHTSPHALVHNQLITIRPEDGHVRFGDDHRSPFHDPTADDFHAKVLANLETLGAQDSYGPPSSRWTHRRGQQTDGRGTSGTGDVLSHAYLAGSNPQIPRAAFGGTRPRRQTFPEARIGEAPPPAGATDPTGHANATRQLRGQELSVGYESHPLRSDLRHTIGRGIPLTPNPQHAFDPSAPDASRPRFTINHIDLARRLIAGLHAGAVAEAAGAARERHLSGPGWADTIIAKSRRQPTERRHAASFVRKLVRQAMGA